jgi:hypothetical protein
MWSRYVLQHWPQAKGKQRLLCVSQQIHDSMFGVAEKNTFAIGEQMQFAMPSCNVGKAVSEVAAQQGEHAANPLQAETTATQVAEDGQLGKIFGGVNATMAFAGGHHDSLLIPPLKLPWREARTG